MKVKILFTLFLLCFVISTINAQNLKLKYIGVDVGMPFVVTQMHNHDFIRNETAPRYYEESMSDNLSSSMTITYGGLTAEFMNKNNRLGITTGLRYTNLYSELGDASSESVKDFFYLMYKQDETNTEYLKINGIKQVSHYLGIPLEIRCYPFKPRIFRLYFKVAADINLQFLSNTNVKFVNNEMEIYEKEVKDKFGKPSALYSHVGASMGFRFGKDDRPSFSYELCLPSFIVTPNSSSLVKPEAIIGFQLNYQLPLKSKEVEK